MSLEITDVREGLANAAGAIAGLRTSRFIADAIAPPMFIVGPYTQDFDLAMARGLDILNFTCWLHVAKSSDRAGQDKIDGYLGGSGALSIKTALEVDKTLGGACAQLHVTGITGYTVYTVSGTDYVGAEFTIKVWG